MKTTRPFRFKRFRIEQQGAAMKVGTDGVLLGAWSSVRPSMNRALDIGTGTGVIALMLAQRGEDFGLRVDAVEIDPGSFQTAHRNVSDSPWADRVEVIEGDIMEFEGEPYDLIVSNPPYFENALTPLDPARTLARHTSALPRKELLQVVLRLLCDDGLFAIVLPYEDASAFIGESARQGLTLTRRTDVKGTAQSEPKRSLMEFAKVSICDISDRPLATEELIIETAPLEYTREYRELTRDFYLKF